MKVIHPGSVLRLWSARRREVYMDVDGPTEDELAPCIDHARGHHFTCELRDPTILDPDVGACLAKRPRQSLPSRCSGLHR